MLNYVIRRVIWLLVVLLGVLTITFALISFIPGDVSLFYAGPHASAQIIAETRHEMGLDQPKIVQYFKYLALVATGNFGQSATLGEPVLTAITQRLPATAMLAGSVIAIEITVAIVVGTLTALYRNSPGDRLAAGLASLSVSVPSFWVGAVLLYLIAFKLRLLPLGGYSDPVFLYLILPALTVGVPGGFWYARILKAGLVETLHEDYIRTARGKGLTRSRVVLRHALPNAIVPMVTIVAMDLGGLLGGIVTVETVFAWPGIGRMAYQAMQEMDTPLILGIVLFTALCIAGLNIVADLLRAILDPRVRLT